MTTPTRTSRLARRAVTAAVATLAVGGSTLAVAAPASAGTSRPPGTASLSIKAVPHSNHMLTVTGKVGTGNLSQAKELLKSKFFVVVWGDDKYNDDFIDFGNYYTWTGASSTGAYFEAVFPIRDSHLDEDYGKDEVYVEVATKYGAINSNNVSGHF